jgi:hypothetical protein
LDLARGIATLPNNVAVFMMVKNVVGTLCPKRQLIRGNMTIEYDDKGKIFTEIVSKVAIQATIQTTTHLIHGSLHVRRDQRIKDELDLNENFLAVTDVNVLGPDGQTLFQAPFLAVRRSHIVWVIPEQDKNEENAS